MKTFAIIPAAGKGKRFGESLPKQFHQINRKEILVYTLEIFQRCSLIDEIIVPSMREYFGLIFSLAEKYKITKLKAVVEGGKERQDSVYNALISIDAKRNDLIVVHDAARPMLNEKLLNTALKAAKKSDNIMVALKGRDTLVRKEKNVLNYVDRENIYYVQTPQIFRYFILKDSLEKAYKENFYGTDESMLVSRAGYKIEIVEGTASNIKITTPEDVEFFKKSVFSK